MVMKKPGFYDNGLVQTIKKRHVIGASLLLLLYAGVFICSAFSTNSSHEHEIPKYNDFAGNEACVSCHKEICESQSLTAHYHSSSPATIASIKGSFAPEKNMFVYNAFMQAQIDTADGIAYQTALINGTAFQTQPFDITVGSGRKGQTYLYWNRNNLYQLPVSYFTPLNTWCNSPGYPSGFIKFDRNISARCLECHGTYAKVASVHDTAVFDKTKIIYGIQCERCHGAAAQHVAYEKAHPKDTSGMFILHIGRLARQQKLDLCALCHSGVRTSVTPAFTYVVGDKLDDYLASSTSTDSLSMLDVHGNQYGLLETSRCFRMSQMDCSSCHNTHVTERNNKILFSERCATCHTDVQHSFATADNREAIVANCIDCHMPQLPSSKITLLVNGQKQTVPDYVTTHHITIYPEQTKAFLQWLKRQKG